MITHVFTMVNISHYFKRSAWPATIRSGGITVINSALSIAAFYNYDKIRSWMEIDAWYLKTQDNAHTFAQIVSLALLSLSILSLFKSFRETIDGPRNLEKYGAAGIEKIAGELKNYDPEESTSLALFQNQPYDQYNGSYLWTQLVVLWLWVQQLEQQRLTLSLLVEYPMVLQLAVRFGCR